MLVGFILATTFEYLILLSIVERDTRTITSKNKTYMRTIMLLAYRSKRKLALYY